MHVIMLLYSELRTQTFLNIFLFEFKYHSALWLIYVSDFTLHPLHPIFRFYFLARIVLALVKSFPDLVKGVCARKCFDRPP